MEYMCEICIIRRDDLRSSTARNIKSVEFYTFFQPTLTMPDTYPLSYIYIFTSVEQLHIFSSKKCYTHGAFKLYTLFLSRNIFSRL